MKNSKESIASNDKTYVPNSFFKGRKEIKENDTNAFTIRKHSHRVIPAVILSKITFYYIFFLSLYAAITTAADDIHYYFFIVFQRKKDLMFQVKMSSAAIFVWRFKV